MIQTGLNMNILKFCFSLMFIISVAASSANAYDLHKDTTDTTENVVSQFDKISYQWDTMAENLEQYEGLSAFCVEATYRTEVIKLLEEVHHMDSLVYWKLKKIARQKGNREIRKTIKQIEALEAEYSIKEFTKFLHVECKDRRALEKERDELKGNLGQDSYGGQQQIIESTLHRYINNVTYLVDHIRKHIHHLHLEEYE